MKKCPNQAWCLILLLFFFGLNLSAAERVAFVIGNDDYENAPVLANPVNDAVAVGEGLEAAGYNVTLLKDASVRDMLKGLRSFCEAAKTAEVAVFFYAGHGIEVKGENYLIPIDVELAEEVDLDLEAVPLEKVMEDIGETGARLKVMVLDCCRDNPLQSTRSWMTKTRSAAGGLAEVDQNAMAEGTMLVFAAAPGKPALDGVDGHSPFTAALLNEMGSPGQSMAGVFSRVALAVSDQEPWIRFDGSGKSFAAFNTYPLLPDGAPGVKPLMIVPKPKPKESLVDPFAGKAAGDSHRNSLGATLRWCPAGEFWMGSPENEEGRDDDEIRHKVELTRGFWMGQHEVTQGEWQSVMGRDLREQARLAIQSDEIIEWSDGEKETARAYYDWDKDTDPVTLIGVEFEEIPIYYVSWNEAIEFCQKLTERERKAGNIPSKWDYRLPTEAEWEYACRAGTSTALYTGGLTIKGYNNGPELDKIAWYGGNSSQGYSGNGWNTDSWEEKQYSGGRAGPRRKGQKEANDWGLNDMIGNVLEWCTDWYGEYPSGFASDPSGSESGSFRVLRCGAWANNARWCRAACREAHSPFGREDTVGFRVVLSSTQ